MITKAEARQRWQGRAYSITMTSLWMSFAIISFGAVLGALGKLTEEFTGLAVGFALVFAAGVGGAHLTNAAQEFRRKEATEDE